MRRPTSLLSRGTQATWRRLGAEKRALRAVAAALPLEERLRRGQRLSAQAAALRRALTGDGAVRPGP